MLDTIILGETKIIAKIKLDHITLGLIRSDINRLNSNQVFVDCNEKCDNSCIYKSNYRDYGTCSNQNVVERYGTYSREIFNSEC